MGHRSPVGLILKEPLTVTRAEPQRAADLLLHADLLIALREQPEEVVVVVALELGAGGTAPGLERSEEGILEAAKLSGRLPAT